MASEIPERNGNGQKIISKLIKFRSYIWSSWFIKFLSEVTIMQFSILFWPSWIPDPTWIKFLLSNHSLAAFSWNWIPVKREYLELDCWITTKLPLTIKVLDPKDPFPSILRLLYSFITSRSTNMWPVRESCTFS